MTDRLTGKVAVVTGAGSGIGAATVRAFHREGAEVIGVDISGKQYELSEELGDGVLGVQADVSKGEDVRMMLETAIDTCVCRASASASLSFCSAKSRSRAAEVTP